MVLLSHQFRDVIASMRCCVNARPSLMAYYPFVPQFRSGGSSNHTTTRTLAKALIRLGLI